jgi:hypothetical protein
MATSLGSSCSLIGGCYFLGCCFLTRTSYFLCCYCCIHVGSTCSPTIFGCYISTITHLLPNIQAFAFALASLCSNVVLPKFKLLERGTWANALTTIYLCSLYFLSFTFAGDQTPLMIVLSHLSTCLWILMIFAFTTIVVHYVVLVSFSCLLIPLSFSTTFCIVFLM